LAISHALSTMFFSPMDLVPRITALHVTIKSAPNVASPVVSRVS
jgi:hypothetical protein